MTLLVDVDCRDTICAPATAHGRAALSIVRVSGPLSETILRSVFKPRRGEQRPFVSTLGDVVDDATIIDEGVCTFYPDQRSFTGEACFELSVHGSPVITKQVLALLHKNGCRPSAPGEFSMRAVLNGKLELTQAESIADLIDAQSPLGAALALRNLKGGLEDALVPVRDTIVSTLCEIEARLDFPDEELGAHHKERLLNDLLVVEGVLAPLLKRSQSSAKLMNGYRVILYGAPNAGKSTLLNALVGEERSIVHESPGTTRDVLEVNWQLEDMPVTLVDVAGIREGSDIHPVEAIGIARAKNELSRADLVLHLKDTTSQEAKLLIPDQTRVISVYTKGDLSTSTLSLDGILISAKTGLGMRELVDRLKNALSQDLPDASELVLTRLRHIELIQQCVDAIRRAIEAFRNGVSDECVAYEIRDAGQKMDELLGTNLNEDVLDLIFSRFCIGK